jgi:hypothetical protein
MAIVFTSAYINKANAHDIHKVACPFLHKTKCLTEVDTMFVLIDLEQIRRLGLRR